MKRSQPLGNYYVLIFFFTGEICYQSVLVNKIWQNNPVIDANAGASIQLSEKMDSKEGSSSARKDLTDSNFASPIQKFPAFQSVANAIPSPKFSESVRSLFFFLLLTTQFC